MNGILFLVGGLILLVLLKQLIDRDWLGLLLSLIALVVVFGAAIKRNRKSRALESTSWNSNTNAQCVARR